MATTAQDLLQALKDIKDLLQTSMRPTVIGTPRQRNAQGQYLPHPPGHQSQTTMPPKWQSTERLLSAGGNLGIPGLGQIASTMRGIRELMGAWEQFSKAFGLGGSGGAPSTPAMPTQNPAMVTPDRTAPVTRRMPKPPGAAPPTGRGFPNPKPPGSPGAPNTQMHNPSQLTRLGPASTPQWTGPFSAPQTQASSPWTSSQVSALPSSRETATMSGVSGVGKDVEQENASVAELTRAMKGYIDALQSGGSRDERAATMTGGTTIRPIGHFAGDAPEGTHRSSHGTRAAGEAIDRLANEAPALCKAINIGGGNG